MAYCVLFAFHASFLILTLTQSGASHENAALQFLFSHGGLGKVTYEVEEQEMQRLDKNGKIRGSHLVGMTFIYFSEIGAIQSNSRKNFNVSMWKPGLLRLCK